MAARRQTKRARLQADASLQDGNELTSSASEEGSDPSTRRRKTTYYTRKESIEALHGQIASLQDELKSSKSYAVRESRKLKALYLNAAGNNRLVLAGTESLLAACAQALGASAAFPLLMYTYLPNDCLERERAIKLQYGHRVDAAMLFMKERTRFLDLSLTHTSSQYLQLSNGDALSIHFDVTPFHPCFRAQEVYAAFQSFFVELEAGNDKSIPRTSRKGVFECGQSREVCEHGDFEVIWNSMSFVKLVKPTWSNGRIHAAAAMDSVDRDDRFPLDQKDGLVNKATATILLTEALTPRGLVVSLSRWRAVFYANSLSRAQVQALESVTTTRWDAMLECVERQLQMASEGSASAPQ